ncbi:RHS repeat-associated core domain-containing protein [Filimonas lacunae]|uniref:RHS repeat-associated core domain-containing protein n=1 Tax=Filimonas lacunae TaxID=477680 RepID=A0A173MN68_9BACT|nr:DUF6531 domain-containing protein [Filimonas lacunae]BAV08841.1 Rhs-family protein [Filimonas lacunae]SIS62616.1 RHS repeat-associated core domain-containing protein [Filimonas lacunae]
MPIENKGFAAAFSEKKDALDHLQAKMASIIPAFPGQNVAKYFDLALGVDFHSTVLPPSPLLPVPHIGMVFDIMSAVMSAIASVLPEPPAPPEPAEGEEPVEPPVTVLSVASAVVNAMKPSVKVHNQWVANAGTGIQHLPAMIAHIAPVVSPMASSEMWMGSSTVLADGGPCSTQFHPALSCNIVGIPSIMRRNKPPKPKMALMAPTSMLLIITSGGGPVMAGGPPTIDLFQLMFKLALKGLGKMWKKARGKGKAKAPETKNPHLGEGHPKEKKICLTDPVDVVTGEVFSSNVDFELPGPIPFTWTRTYYSNAECEGPLGYNWHHSYNMGIYDMGNEWFTVRLRDGREAAMPALAFGDAYYNRKEQLLWQREYNGYVLVDRDKLIYRFSGNRNKEGFQMLSAIETLTGFCIRFFYSASGVLLKMEDSSNRILHVASDALGRIESVYSDAVGLGRINHVQYRYDEAGNLVEITNATGGCKTYSYAERLLTGMVSFSGHRFYWEYEGRGDDARCVHAWGDNGVMEYWFQYEDGKTLSRNSLGHITQYYYDVRNLVYKVVDANGGITMQEYNEFDELELVVNPEGLSIKYQYNVWGKIIKYINENGEATVYKYDDQLNMVDFVTPAGASYSNEYDDKGRVISRSYANGVVLNYEYAGPLLERVSDNRGRSFCFRYDDQYNVTRLQMPNGTHLHWAFDSLGRLEMATDAAGNNTSYKYDAAGNMTGVHQADGVKHYLEYDAAGNMIHARDNNGHEVFYTYGFGEVLVERRQDDHFIRFNYDTEQQLKSIANEGGELYKYGFDAVGNVVSEWGFDGINRRYVRDGAGRVTKVLRPGGRWTNYQYDGVGNAIGEEHFDGSMAAYRYNKDGRLVEAVNDCSVVSLLRDTAGRIVKEKQGVYEVDKQYNEDGQCVFTSSNLGAAIELGYTSEGFLSAMQVKQQGQELWGASWQRNDTGLELLRELTGGIQVRTERDRLGRVERRRIGVHHIEESSMRYEWGRGDKLNKIVNEITHAKAEFNYDTFNNLASATYSQNNTLETIYRVPDKIGNIYKTPQRNDRVYAKGGQLTEDEKHYYYYDVEGNLLFKEFKLNANLHAEDKQALLQEAELANKGSGTGWWYVWNANGSLNKVITPAGNEVVFCYDALGRRIAKNYKGIVTRWVWDGNTPLHEWSYQGEYPPKAVINAAGKVVEEEEVAEEVITWVFEGGTFAPCAKIDKGKTYSIVTDYLGTPTHAYDNEGNKVWERELDCYGNLLHEKGEKNFIPYLYQGQYIDGETGLAYNRFRYYNPETGTYISQDPIRFGGRKLQLYLYVHDVNVEVDPSGLIILQQVPYDNHPLSDAIIDYRNNNPGITSGRNVAAAELNNGDVIVKSSDGIYHSEKYLLDELDARNAMNDVKHLYTELEPCSGIGMQNCMGKLERALPQNQVVMYSNPYPVSDGSVANKKARRKGVSEKKKSVKEHTGCPK